MVIGTFLCYSFDMERKHIVKEGVYIPDTGITYPDVPTTYLVPAEKLREVRVDENYPFLDDSPCGKLRSFLVYTACFLFAFPLNKIRYGLKIVGRKNIRKNRHLLKNGAVTCANHVYRWDFVSILYSLRFRKIWFPVRREHMEGKDAYIIRGIGGIPISETLAGGRKFNKAFDELNKKKKWIHVFPESCRWDFYQPIRPFKNGAFTFAVRWNVPVIPMAFSYRKPGLLRRLLGTKHPLITLTIGEPILPNLSLGRKEALNMLRDETHKSICSLAGIKENMWDSFISS